MMKILFYVFVFLTVIGPAYILLTNQIDFSADYRTANRQSAHLAPDPKTTHEAVIQFYAARAFNWRGLFATHVWFAVKPKNAANYTVYQVVGWHFFRGLSAVVIEKDIPDRYWFNQKPWIFLDVRGPQAEKLIPKMDAAAKSYPYANQYELWPGPNSNTFPAYVARHVPELELVLPSTAIGKDFLPGYQFLAIAPSGTGYQLSFFGMFGILVAKKEGIEVNLFSMVYGIKWFPFAILLPGIGSIPNHSILG